MPADRLESPFGGTSGYIPGLADYGPDLPNAKQARIKTTVGTATTVSLFADSPNDEPKNKPKSKSSRKSTN
ncbi:hypothetical protein RSOLAG22IIIB_08698 [Rhizoctonia solani]|uniref:Uncharacterized protein n=1 Tax=Rhizoctonia solani TaxID=456999 RepID=A0A0K6FUC9_9AGAM|nr:hypothetical protein RSOLAG22IIIB_08698 [Rhizoctonia solani]